MSYEVFGEPDEGTGFTDDRVGEIGSACFARGA
jgi:hypothetical protein